MWSLIWGRELTRGQQPGFEALPIAPVPHPLANAVAALASLWGRQGPAVLEVVGFLSLGLLGWAAFRLGRELYGVAVGAAFALVLLTAPPMVDASLQAIADVPFLALVLWAAVVEARRPDRAAPLVLLLLAGLLRPEAWLLSAALVAWRARSGWSPQLIRWALLAASAPLLWALCDLVVTGDPFHSLHATRTFGGLLGAPTGTGAALGEAATFLRFFLADPIVWAGLAGVPLGLWLLYRRSQLPAAVLALGLAALGALGVAGVPLTYRYAVVPVAMIALFAAVAVLGWTALPAGAARSRWRAAGAVGALVVVASSAPSVAGDLELVSERAARMRDRQEALAASRRCLPAREFLLVPYLAYRADVDPARLSLRRRC